MPRHSTKKPVFRSFSEKKAYDENVAELDGMLEKANGEFMDMINEVSAKLLDPEALKGLSIDAKQAIMMALPKATEALKLVVDALNIPAESDDEDNDIGAA